MLLDWQQPHDDYYCTGSEGPGPWASVMPAEEDRDTARPWVWASCDWPPWLPDEGDASERTRQGTAAAAAGAMRATEAAFLTST
jgi:hypothetical protein